MAETPSSSGWFSDYNLNCVVQFNYTDQPDKHCVLNNAVANADTLSISWYRHLPIQIPILVSLNANISELFSQISH